MLMQNLEIFERPTCVLKLNAHLAQLRGEMSCQVSHRKVSQQIHHYDYLKCCQCWPGGGIRGDRSIEIQFDNGAEKSKCQSCGDVGPDTRKKNASDNDNERIKKIKRAVDPARDVDDQSHKQEIGNDLQCCLKFVLLPDRKQQNVEQRYSEPQENRKYEESDW